MPTGFGSDAVGQYVNFASVADPDATYTNYVWIRALKGDTIKKIAARRSDPKMANAILQLNIGRDVVARPRPKPGKKVPPITKLKSITNVLRTGATIKLPGTMAQGFYFSAYAGDRPPVVKTAYAEFDVVKVPGRVGINRFLGYPPIVIEIDVQFEAFGQQGSNAGYLAGQGSIEDRIATLERMAGRGPYPGAAYGPPAVIVVNTTDNAGNVIPLIPLSYQWTPKNQTAPQFRITAIAWDDTTQLRNDAGYRVRQKATVTLTQYTPLLYVVRSAAARNKQGFTPPSPNAKAAPKK
jgi:hypothetical protein